MISLAYLAFLGLGKFSSRLIFGVFLHARTCEMLGDVTMVIRDLLRALFLMNLSVHGGK